MTPQNETHDSSFADKVVTAIKGLFASKQAVAQHSAKISDMLGEVARLAPDAALAKMGSGLDGLSSEEAEKRIEIYGKNQVAREDHKGAVEQILRLLLNPLNIMLLVLAILNFVFLDDFESGSVVSLMVILSVTLCFVQERRSNNAAEKLRAMVSTTASVLRRAVESEESETGDHAPARNLRKAARMELPIEDLVPGDVIWLSAGDITPADVRLLSARDLFINQSALTGESMPIEKFPGVVEPDRPGKTRVSSNCPISRLWAAM